VSLDFGNSLHRTMYMGISTPSFGLGTQTWSTVHSSGLNPSTEDSLQMVNCPNDLESETLGVVVPDWLILEDSSV
jgi:hypothetical protein